MTEGPDGAACWLAEAFCGDRRGCHPRGFGRKRQGIRVCAEARAEVEDANGASCSASAWLRWGARAEVEDVKGASCSASVWLRWGAKQELGGGEPFDDVHSSTADWATPEWVSLI